MLSENIARIRKSKGMSQEALADRVHVVRQTVSKWEKGLSVPDADALTDLAEALGSSVGELLGGDAEPNPRRDDVAERLSTLNELLAEDARRRKRTFRLVFGIGLCVLLVPMLVAALIAWMGTVGSVGGVATVEESVVAVEG